jgi:hypothetical protein
MPIRSVLEAKIRMLKIGKEQEEVRESSIPGKSSLAFWSEFAIEKDNLAHVDSSSDSGSDGELPSSDHTPQIGTLVVEQNEPIYEHSSFAREAQAFNPVAKKKALPTMTRAVS